MKIFVASIACTQAIALGGQGGFNAIGPVLGAYTFTPQYLSVKGHELCLGLQDMGGWSKFCKPAEKPEGCPDDIYAKLFQELTDFNDPDTHCYKVC